MCRFTRVEILKLIKFVFHLASGFTFQKHWKFILSKIAHDICNSIMTLSSFDINWFAVNFDCDEICLQLQLTLKRIYPCFQFCFIS